MLESAVTGTRVVTLGNALRRVVSLQPAENVSSAKAGAPDVSRPGASSLVDSGPAPSAAASEGWRGRFRVSTLRGVASLLSWGRHRDHVADAMIEAS